MSLHEEITTRILSYLEQGIVPWVKPWGVPLPFNAATQRRYSGINVLLLWDTQYERPTWLTFHQARKIGGRVRKGERATRIVFTSTVTAMKDDEERSISFLKWHCVFNVAQVDGLPPECYAAPVFAGGNDVAERFLNGVKADVRHGGVRAYYSPVDDHIQLPHPEHFVSRERYYMTALHEHVHWTGHPSRLARDTRARFGEQAYAFEELVAELGASYLSAELNLPSELHTRTTSEPGCCFSGITTRRSLPLHRELHMPLSFCERDSSPQTRASNALPHEVAPLCFPSRRPRS